MIECPICHKEVKKLYACILYYIDEDSHFIGCPHCLRIQLVNAKMMRDFFFAYFDETTYLYKNNNTTKRAYENMGFLGLEFDRIKKWPPNRVKKAFEMEYSIKLKKMKLIGTIN